MNDLLLNLILTLDAAFRVCVPLIFASMAGLFAERSGVVDIGLEGKLLMSAFIAASAASVFGSPWIGLLFAILRFTEPHRERSFKVPFGKIVPVLVGLSLMFLMGGIEPPTIMTGARWGAKPGNSVPYRPLLILSGVYVGMSIGRALSALH